MATILIVDDVSANRKFLVSLLGTHGHQLIQAANGAEGLAAVQAQRPDLVITDVLMPVMDGYEFVRRLRLDPANGRLPVLFYTAPYGEREAKVFARAAGVPYVLRKPALADDVLTIVALVLAGEPPAHADSDDSSQATEADFDHFRLLTDELSEKAEDLRVRNARLRALINIGLGLASSHGSERLLHNVCDEACDLFGATYATLGIVDRDACTVRRFVTSGTEEPPWLSAGDEISGILATVVTERRAVRGDGVGGHAADVQLPKGHPEVQAFLGAPIASRAHVYGWIWLVGNEGRAFSTDDQPMLMALAGQIGRTYELEYEILERRQAESAVRRERDRAQRYLDAAEVILLALDLDGRVTLINRKGCDLLGWAESELVGRDWTTTCVPERTRPLVTTALRNLLAGDLSLIENEILTRSGAERLVEWRNTLLRDEAGAIVGILSSGTDVTERHALEVQRQQGQKMEAVGQLAGGVAHDFNNLLTAILGYCELLQGDLAPGDPHLADVAEIHRAGVSAAGLTRQLLAFSRKEIIEPTWLDLNLVVTGMEDMLRRLIREDVRIALTLKPGSVAIKADRAQIEQVVMNLVLNARDAMPSGGTLNIETCHVDIDDDYARSHPPVLPGPYVALTVSDTGSGMTAEVQARLFEPFFTTKELGQGTGLGLATVQGIVVRAGGAVNVYSEPGRGTSFKVYLPRVQAEGLIAVIPPASRSGSGAETILVVEDSEGLRELTKRLLEKQGYTVLVAASADEAFQMFESHGASIDLLLTDVVMPGIGGPELSQRLIGRWPALKIVFMSGYTAATIVSDGVVAPGIAFLHKPFTADTLGRKLREVLDLAPTLPIAPLRG